MEVRRKQLNLNQLGQVLDIAQKGTRRFPNLCELLLGKNQA